MSLPSGPDEVLLLHNPRCSKSRAVKALLEERGIAFTERRYLEEPLDPAELRKQTLAPRDSLTLLRSASFGLTSSKRTLS